MSRKSEDRAPTVDPRPSTEFLGLVAACAFIAAGPSAAAVTEKSADQFREDTFSLAASLASSPSKADAGNGGSFRLAQSTQGEDDGGCNEYTGTNCNSDNEVAFGPFDLHTLESDPYTLMPIDTWIDEAGIDITMSHWGAPLAHGGWNPFPGQGLRMFYGAGGPGARCLVGGGAITFIVKTRRTACWRPAKAPPVRGVKGLTLGPAAQRVLTSCKLGTGSVILRKGAFACINTPRVVVRSALRGVRGRASLGWPWLG